MTKANVYASLKLLLGHLNVGNKSITTKEIKALIDEDNDFFNEQTQDVLKYLVKKNLICAVKNDVYDIAVDIATLRKIILNFNVSQDDAPLKKQEDIVGLDEVLNLEWVAIESDDDEEEEDDEEEDDDDDEEDDAIAARRAYLERKRKELIERMNKELNDDDEEGDDEEEDDDNGDDKEEDDAIAARRAYLERKRQELIERLNKELSEDDEDDEDDNSNSASGKIINGEKISIQLIDDEVKAEPLDTKRMLILSHMKQGIKAVQNANSLQVRSFSSNTMINIAYGFGELIYLTDNGDTIKHLKEINSGISQWTRNAIENICFEHKVRIVDDVISVEVDENDAFERYCNFCAAIDRINNLDDRKIQDIIEFRRLDDLMFDIMQQLIKDNLQITRADAILLMQKKYATVKDSQDYDNIIIYAKAIKEFGMLTNEQFEYCRKQIIGG